MTDGYYSLNAFYLVDSAGVRHAVRWEMAPEAQERPMRSRRNRRTIWTTIARAARAGSAALASDAHARESGRSGRQRDARLAERPRTIDVGTLVIDSTQPQDDGPCRDVNYDPLVLPTGIEASGDPLLPARSARLCELV